MGGGRRALVALVSTLVGVPFVLAAQAPVDVQLQHADARGRDGRFTDAADTYRRILAGEAADSVRERARAGLTLALLRTGDFAAARAEGAGLAEAPGAESLALYGDSLWSSGLFDEAERAYAASLARDPGQPRAHHGRARALTARGRLDDALGEAREASRGKAEGAEFHQLPGVICERQRRFAGAAAAFGEYGARLPDRDH